jgi:hypothetical protein
VISFNHGSRDWIAYKVEAENHTHFLWLVKPAIKGQPFPTPAEYKAARQHFNRTFLHRGKPRPRLAAIGNRLLAP